MRKIKKYLFVILLVTVARIFSNNSVYAIYVKYYSIDFLVNINTDGSMQVVEVWDMYINKGNTAYKEFILEEDKYGEIKNVSVKEINQSGIEKSFIDINKEMKKVTPNSYYALINSKGHFEIALGTGLENSSGRKVYEISYTVTDVIKSYNDCNEFCWKFIGYNHGSSVQKVTGNIYLPSSVKEAKNLRAWAHGSLNGSIKIQDNRNISFEVTNVYANEIVEVRIAVLEDMFTLNTNKIPMDNFNNILQEEQKFANEANTKRKNVKIITTIVQITIALITLLFIRKLISKINKDKKELNKVKEIIPTEKYKYYRELPNKNMTAGDIGFIYYYEKDKFRKKFGNILSANMLSLHLKKYINILKDKEGNIEIEINKRVENKNDLERDELQLLNIFTEISRKLKTTFTMKEFKKYIKSFRNKKMIARFEDIKYTIERNAQKNKIYKLSQEKIRSRYKDRLKKSWLILIFVFFVVVGMGGYGAFKFMSIILNVLIIVYMALMLLDISIIKKIIKRNSQLTQKGTDYCAKLDGLKRYLEDFSVIKEREALDVNIWREYLICAVVLGVSKKIVKQIMGTIPDVKVIDNLSYYWSCSHYLDREVSKISGKVNRVERFRNIANSYYSSGSGYGGGFSSGDAGGGR